MTATLAESSGPHVRQGLLGRLAAALEGLGRRAGMEQGMLHAASALAPRAEAAAIRARLLAFGCAEDSATLANALAADIGGLATEAGALATRADRAAAAGGAIGGAIAGHAAALAALAAGPCAADPSRLRRLLAPLVATLETVPVQRQQQAAIGSDLARLAEQARPLADRAVAVAGQAGAAAKEEALRLSHELGALAAEAGRLADAIGQEKTAGAQDAAAMTGAIRGMATAEPPGCPGAAAAGPMPGAAAPLPQPRMIAAGVPWPERRFGRAQVWTPKPRG